jgi:hypothetical protein
VENPGSTTNTMPSIVKDVSAIFVLTTTFRPGGPPETLAAGTVSQDKLQIRSVITIQERFTDDRNEQNFELEL